MGSSCLRSTIAAINQSFLLEPTMQLERLEPRPWMSTCLRAAGIYNLIWGGWVVLFPLSVFRLSGFEELPRYPQIWQCLGMVIGVYGIGYWLAARNPFVHWPIVLVGMLGKIFGPIGFVSAVIQGQLPGSMSWVILTNDLIWWWPFGAILWSALLHHQLEWSQSDAPAEIGDPVRDLKSQHGRSLAELSQNQPTLVVFLRHSGCTFCREALDDLEQQRPDIEAQGVRLAIVHMDTEENATSLVARYHLQDIDRFRDAGQYLYRHFQLGLGSVTQLLGPTIWWKGFQAAILRKHGIGQLGGNGFRMPGAFVVRDGRVIASFRHQTAADRPDYRELACHLEGLQDQSTVGADV